ncbi:MAG TPA: hypothetical protein VF316_19790 [Polyangiaceae bacterium]
MAKKAHSSGGSELVFRKVASCAFSELRSATAVTKAQVVQTIEMRDGDSFDEFEACAAALPRLFDVGEDELELERYEITRAGDPNPSHEMWVYEGEHGLVFELGSDTPTPVRCVQRHFWSVDEDDPAAVALASLLDAAAVF